MERQAVLVTGGAGYLGSVLAGKLCAAGHRVTVVDNHATSPRRAPSPGIRHVEADIRDVGDWSAALRGIDAVVHLAAIVGDPACEVDHDLTWETNYLATVGLVGACRAAGVGRFVLASSCSNYGESANERARTLSPMQPKSLYAQSKIYAEHHVLSSRCPSFRTVILRLATLYGLSPRMRFDLAVNTMTAMAVQQRRVVVHGGEQWRPFLHVEDAAEAFALAVGVPAGGSSGGIYNCGSNGENYRLRDIGEMVAAVVPGARLEVTPSATDPRDYQVDFTSSRSGLGLRPGRSVRDGVAEMAAALRHGRFQDFTDPAYSNLALVRAAAGGRQPAMAAA
ncbi:NAD-dependent epimerase/dehydratase family protein [Micromonospora inyonensis]|uniref:Nucleoside-diphosphate-sugar epimerase n=1 Tax=Micromonospora inyonensis TaxID=47866 RepID=A0A1C6S793_9ACTN|nr:NAD(P)-dependent oxidoreductase [Micromonospora inyonensis]SCL25340.1 Nucleoside-diphosphate-sugar epimerase [Micromonospora inyonensis]